MEPNYIREIICKIVALQRQDFDPDTSGCDRPFLGPSITNNSYNTRPVQLFNAFTSNPWSFDDISMFRIESYEDDAVEIILEYIQSMNK